MAPGNPPMRLDLPPSRNVDGGILIAPERAAETTWRMECLQRWPRACQVTLDAQDSAAAVELAEQQRVTREVAALRFEEQPSSRWPSWLVAILGVGAGAAVGLGAGLILGFVAGGQR